MDEKRWREELERALQEHHKEGPDAQASAVEEFLLAEPTQETTDVLWRIVVIGLLALTGIGLVGLIGLLACEKDAQIALTAFSALLAGLLGLFVQSPFRRGDDSS